MMYRGSLRLYQCEDAISEIVIGSSEITFDGAVVKLNAITECL